MKKTLTLAVLAGLMLTGCGGGKSAVQPAVTATAVADVVENVTVPGVLGLALDKATLQLEDLGFEVEAVDTVDGKSILSEKNWQVMSQDPTEGASAAKGSTVHLGVKSLDKIAADKAAAAEKAAAEKAAAEKAAAEATAAAKAAADKAAADKAAADQAAAQAAQQAAKTVPAPVAPAPAPVAPAPVAPAYYANCSAAKAAGAAPLYAGQPGYSTSLDRDRDGVACES